MSTIVFENGTRVNFDGDPTPEDVDFVAKQVGISKSEAPAAPESAGKGFLKSLLNFPAKIASTAAIAGTSAAALMGSKKANLATQRIQKEGIDLPLVGKTKPIQDPLEAAGVGLEGASFLSGGAGVPAVLRGVMAGKKLAPVVKGIAAGAGSGAQFGAGTALQDEERSVAKTVAETAKGAGLGGLTGGVLGGLPIAPAAVRAGSRALGSKPLQPLEAAGQILQGTEKENRLGLKILKSIDTQGVRSYKDLSARIDEKIKSNLKTVDDEFEKVPGVKKMKDLVRKVTVGEGKEALSKNVNHVEDALDQLKKYYTSTKNTVKRLEVQMLINKAKAKGLSTKEINKIAKMHGDDLNAFNANGELASGLSRQAAENTRKGVKETARSFTDSKVAEAADKETSNLIRVKELTDDMAERVQKLRNRVKERSLGAKLGRWGMNTFDLFTAGILKGAIAAALPSNVGLKVMNAIDLEKQLVKNLKAIEYLENASDDVLEAIVSGMQKGNIKDRILDMQKLN